MNLDILPVIRESMGFAGHRFETAARLAWFPLLLILLFFYMFPYLQVSVLSGDMVTLQDTSLTKARQVIQKNQEQLWQNNTATMLGLVGLLYLVVITLSTSFIVPLLRLAARGEDVTHRSLSLSFGPRHLKFVAASFVAIAGVSLVTLLPLGLITNYIDSHVTAAMQTQYAVFPDAQSLHSITLESALTDREPYDNFTASLSGVIGIMMLYLSIRLFAAPIFVAVREKGDGYNSFLSSWRLTKGWNTFWVALAAVILAGTIWVVTYVLNAIALPLISDTLNAIYRLMAGVAGLAPDAPAQSPELLAFLRWSWVVINMIANIIWVVFLTGTIAGLGGALFKRMPQGEGATS